MGVRDDTGDDDGTVQCAGIGQAPRRGQRTHGDDHCRRGGPATAEEALRGIPSTSGAGKNSRPQILSLQSASPGRVPSRPFIEIDSLSRPIRA